MRKGRTLTAILASGILIAVAAGALFVFWPQLYSFYEEELIWSKKAAHWHSYDNGKLPLPGTPDLATFNQRLAAAGVPLGAPILVRIFKREFELEIWVKRDDQFVRFATYPICMWSGGLGPKIRQGDRQAPEGFYTVDQGAMNPNSKYRRSFNLGFPNAFDRAYGRTGSALMVHGNCRSIGCYAMTDPVIDEIWTLATAALNGGQKRFQVQVFPFRLTQANLDWHAHDAAEPFWRQLQKGYDSFEKERIPPVVGVCNGAYAFRSGSGAKDGSDPIVEGCS